MYVKLCSVLLFSEGGRVKLLCMSYRVLYRSATSSCCYNSVVLCTSSVFRILKSSPTVKVEAIYPPETSEYHSNTLFYNT
jgi:hypothetical protein